MGSHAKLNDKDYLEELIGAVQKANKNFAVKKPILLKIAPDLNTTQLDEIVDTCFANQTRWCYCK